MSMRPEDVRATRFREGWRGYDEDEVDDFMSRVGHALQVLANERDEAVARAEELAKDAQDVMENERLLRRTLLTAERTAEETVQRAEAEAERLLSEARAEAERLRIEAHDRARREVQQAADTTDRIRRSVQEFRTFRDDYQARIRAVVSEQLKALERVGELPDLPDHVAEFEELEFVRPSDAGSTGAPSRAPDSEEPVPSVLDQPIDRPAPSPGGDQSTEDAPRVESDSRDHADYFGG